MIIKSHGCPVCGFSEFEALDESGCTTFEICPACGCESGCDYGKEEKEERLKELRQDWVLKRKAAWWSSHTKPPHDWDPKRQLDAAGLRP